MITGFHTLWCQTSNMDRSVAFYRDVVGLEPNHVSPYWSDFKVGDGLLGLHPPLEGASEPFGAEYKKGWFIGLRTTDIKALRARLEAAEATLFGDYHDVPGSVILDFADPDGNVLEAVQVGISTKDLE